jgi:hypothetical protein
MYDIYKDSIEAKGLTESVLDFDTYCRESLRRAEEELAWDAECLKRECPDVLEE